MIMESSITYFDFGQLGTLMVQGRNFENTNNISTALIRFDHVIIRLSAELAALQTFESSYSMDLPVLIAVLTEQYLMTHKI